MKKPSQHLIAEVPRSITKVGMTIGIDLGDVWRHYCTLNEDGEVVDRGRFRTSPSGVEKWFTDLPPVRIAMEAGTHSIWISEQFQELGHEVIVANVRELRAISHSDRKSDQVDAEKLARYARLDPKILRPIAHRTVAQQENADVDPLPQPECVRISDLCWNQSPSHEDHLSFAGLGVRSNDWLIGTARYVPVGRQLEALWKPAELKGFGNTLFV
jgi:Transposase